MGYCGNKQPLIVVVAVVVVVVVAGHVDPRRRERVPARGGGRAARPRGRGRGARRRRSRPAARRGGLRLDPPQTQPPRQPTAAGRLLRRQGPLPLPPVIAFVPFSFLGQSIIVPNNIDRCF